MERVRIFYNGYWNGKWKIIMMDETFHRIPKTRKIIEESPLETWPKHMLEPLGLQKTRWS